MNHILPHDVYYASKGYRVAISTLPPFQGFYSALFYRVVVVLAGNVEWGDKALLIAQEVLGRPENQNLSLYLFRLVGGGSAFVAAGLKRSVHFFLLLW